MKKRILSLVLLLALCLGLLPTTALAAITPASSSNQYWGDYTSAASCIPQTPISSYLYTEGGRIIRVEPIKSGTVTVETYNSSFSLTDSKTISLGEDFLIWGGFYAGEKYNFVLLGRPNPEHDDSVDTYCVIKFSKDWERLDTATLNRADTANPFQSSQPRFFETDGILYIHASRKMYNGHQASSLYRVQEDTMDFENLSYLHYISHSFNQFVSMDNKGNLILLDHGDGLPRGANLHRLDPDTTLANPERYPDNAMVTIRAFKGEFGENNTGATLGGLARTSTGFLTALSDTNLGDKALVGSATHNIYLTYTPDNNFTEAGTVTKQVTNYPAGGSQSVGTPFLVPTGRDSGYLLWKVKERDANGVYQNSGTLAYATYNSDTGALSAVKTDYGALSDCSPIPYSGGLLWYVTANSVPTFYHLTPSGITAHTAGGSVEEPPVIPAKPANPITLTDEITGTVFTLSDVRSEELTRMFRIEASFGNYDGSFSVLHLAPNATVKVVLPNSSAIPWGPSCYLCSENRLVLSSFAHFESEKNTFTLSDLRKAAGVQLSSGQTDLYELAFAGYTPWLIAFDGDIYKPASTPFVSALSRGEDPLRYPVISEPATASPTNDKLTVNGQPGNATVYKINDSNYFKIRDVAALLNGTEKQFSVGYDGEKKSVTATTGQGYVKQDTDLLGAPVGGNKTAEPSNDTIYVDGVKIEAEVYKIDGSNYFKLRDLGRALNFSVDWARKTGMSIDTGKPYTE